MSATFPAIESDTTEKPELVLRSPAFKALGSFLVGGIISGVFGLYELTAYFDNKHDIDEFTIFLVLASSVGCFSIVIGNVLTRRTLVVMPEGFAYFVGKKADFCRWNEIASIRRHLARNDEYDLPRATYWIRDHGGREFKLPDFRLDHTDCFGEWFLIPRVRERLLEQALADYDAGREVEFGPIRISETGIHSKNSQLAWDEIENVEADLAGDFVVRKRGRLFAWCEPSAKRIPNLFVLFDLIRMRHRNRVIVKDSILDWWNQLLQPLWHRDFGHVQRPGVVHLEAAQRPWQRVA